MQADNSLGYNESPEKSIANGSVNLRRPRTKRRPLVVFGATVLGFFVLLFALPGNLNDKLLLLATGACAQRPGHSYFMAGMQLPMEGRMVGIFGGFALTLFFLWFIGRGRAFHQPPLPVMLVLVAMVATIAIDGLNATAYDMQLPTLYTPQNWLRLTTGVLSGIGLAGLTQPFFNSITWRRGYNRRSFENWGELIVMLSIGLLLGLATASGWNWLYWPIALLTVGGLIVALVVMNSMVFTVALRRENRIDSAMEMLTPISLIFIFSLGELILFGAMRVAFIGSPV